MYKWMDYVEKIRWCIMCCVKVDKVPFVQGAL